MVPARLISVAPARIQMSRGSPRSDDQMFIGAVGSLKTQDQHRKARMRELRDTVTRFERYTIRERRRSMRSVLTQTVSMALLVAACQSPTSGPSPSRTSRAITPADVRARIFLVADDSMRGRQSGFHGNFAMTEYMGREMARLRLEPGGENGTYFQIVPLVRRSADTTSSLTVRGHRLALFSDFALLRPSATLRLGTTLAPRSYATIYAGRAGDSSAALSAADVTGRIVILDAPLDTAGRPTGVYSTPAAVAVSRYPTAAGIAIAALDLVTPATATSLRGSGNGLLDRAPSTQRPFGLLLSQAAAERIMGRRLSALRAGARGSEMTARVRFVDRPVQAPARNVIAILRGSDPSLRGQYVAIGAHNDHTGIAARAVEHDSLRAYNRVMRPEGAQTSASASSTPTAAQWSRIRAILDSLRRLRPARMDSINNGADD